MNRPTPLPSNFSMRPFAMDEARRAGISQKRSRGKDLWTPTRGIRVPVDAPFSLLESCRAYAAVTPHGVVSHLTAAKIHGLYLPQRYDELPALDLSRSVGEPQPRRKEVNGRLLVLAPDDIVNVSGVPITTVQRTFLDIATLLSVDELVVIGDQLVCEHHRSFGRATFPKVQLGILNAYLAQHAGARGMRRLRTAMDLVKVGADSRPETHLRLMITRSPLPNFEPNIEIKDAAGRGVVAPDLACEDYKTCAEYEGEHHFTPAQQSKDHDRNFVTTSMGWHQVLINKDDMRAGELVVITKIARMLVAGGWPDPQNLAGRSFQGKLHTRKDFG